MKPKKNILEIRPYRGGKPIEEVKRELGIDEAIKLASNENPLGPSPLATAAIQKAIPNLNFYPDGNAFYLKRKLAEKLDIRPENLILGNGSNEILQLLGETFLSPGDEVIFSKSAFVVYKLVAQICAANSIETEMIEFDQDLSAMLRAISDRTKIIFVANPNNPTGTMITADQVEKLMSILPENVLIVFDEAYAEYIDRDDYPNTLDYVRDGRNVIVTRTFSKIYGLAGLRIGYGIAKSEIIELLNVVRQPFNVNSLAQIAALAAIDDEEHVRKSRDLNHKGKLDLYHFFDEIGLDYVQSEGNFILVHLDRSGSEVSNRLLKKGVIVRSVAGYGFPNSIRVTIGTPDQNQKFMIALREIL